MDNPFAPIGLRLPDGLPNKEYAISDGTVSVILDQSGGINMIEYQGPRRTDGARRGAFYSNGVWRREDFFPEPVISFSVGTGAESQPVPFANLALCPFGVSSTFQIAGIEHEFRIWIRGNAVMVECYSAGASDTKMTVRVIESFTQHHNDSSAWDEPKFDPEFNSLRYNLRRSFILGTTKVPPRTGIAHEACSMIGSFADAQCTRSEGTAELTAPVSAESPCRFAIVFAEDVRRAEWLLLEAQEDHERWLEEQLRIYRTLSEGTPHLEADGLTVLPEIARVAPLFIRSMRRTRNADEVAFRASTRGYGIFGGWDGQWGCRVLDACADDETVRRYLNFLDATRGPNGAINLVVDYNFDPLHDHNLHSPPADRHLGDGWTIVMDAWFIQNLHEYYFRTGDRELLDRVYPGIARAIGIIHGNASDKGLVESCFGGTDYADQLGRPLFDDPRDNRTLSSRLTGTEDIGILFNACHLGAELAGVMSDEATLEQCVDLITRIEQHFVSLFFDEEDGYLIDCVWSKDDPVNRTRMFRLLTLLCLTGYGELLVMDLWERIAEFVMDQMRHPLIGLRSVARDQPIPDSGARFKEVWLQNATREVLKFSRLSGCAELLDLQLSKFEEHFEKERVVREDLYNLQAPQHFTVAKSYVSTSWWQNMTASAWWHGIMEAFAGLRWERGLLEYLPGDGGRDVRISNLNREKHTWEISVTGRGRWVESMTVNGERNRGSYQLLPRGDSREQRVEITKTDESPQTPVVFSSGASPLHVTSLELNKLLGTLECPGFARLWFYSPRKPHVRVNGHGQDYRWVEGRKEGTAMVVGKGRLELEIGW